MRTLLIFFLLAGVLLPSFAQLPAEVKLGSNPSVAIYDPHTKQLLASWTGTDATRLNENEVLVTNFVVTAYRDGQGKEIRMIGKSPQCHLDVPNHVAFDSGPLQIFTPTTNLYVQGVGFSLTESNHMLVISNQVETRVEKGLLKSPMLGANTNTAGSAGKTLKIFADHCQFDYRSNVVDYAGNVHVIDPQLDMTSKKLSIQFGTNGAVETILAQEDVVLTEPNRGRATGSSAFYYVTNNNETMELAGNAVWRNGDQEAKARQFTYDQTRRLLTASDHVQIRWPNRDESGATNFQQLHADFATLQLPPDNGPAESMIAEGNVVILNEADNSRATAGKAVYFKTNDWFKLLDHPTWANAQTEVRGEVLSMGQTNKTYRADGDAHLKLKVTSAGKNQKASADQWLFVTSSSMEYQTNLAIFHENVHARYEENDAVQETLVCKLLTVTLAPGNQVETAVARGEVHAETAPDANAVKKTLVCDTLTAHRSPKTGLLQEVVAEDNVTLEMFGTATNTPHDKVTAEFVIAHFSAVTNRMEQAVAERKVVFDQIKEGKTTRATGDHAVYTAGVNERVELTGHPWAKTDTFILSNASRMLWTPQNNLFDAFGPYKIDPIAKVAKE